MVLVDNDEICVVLKDIFENVCVVVEFLGVILFVGLKKYVKKYGIEGENFVCVFLGVNFNFYIFCFVFECCEIGEKCEVLLVVIILE